MAEERHPRNLRGVLRMAVEAEVSGNEGPSIGPSNALSSLSQEEMQQRRLFLDSVMNSLTVDVKEIMKQAISILVLPESDNENEIVDKLYALDQLLEWVDNLDFATSFHNIGGFVTLQPCLTSDNADIRSKTAELIAELVQNHPYCQKAVTETKLLEILIRLLDTDANDAVRIKCLYAISALLRDNSKAQDDFLEHDGFSVILRALQSNIEKLKIKSAFLLTALCTQRSSFKDTLYNMGFVEQLVALIQKEHDETQEHVIGALLSLVTDHPSALLECQREELNLKETLSNRMLLLEGNDQYLEELQYCRKLMVSCFNNLESENQPQDR